MLWYVPVIVYPMLACATVVPPPGTVIQAPKPTPQGIVAPTPTPQPDWDILGICTALNKAGVQTNPSLNPQAGPQPK
jgi:hypothetical protein